MIRAQSLVTNIFEEAEEVAVAEVCSEAQEIEESEDEEVEDCVMVDKQEKKPRGKGIKKKVSPKTRAKMRLKEANSFGNATKRKPILDSGAMTSVCPNDYDYYQPARKTKNIRLRSITGSTAKY